MPDADGMDPPEDEERSVLYDSQATGARDVRPAPVPKAPFDPQLAGAIDDLVDETGAPNLSGAIPRAIEDSGAHPSDAEVVDFQAAKAHMDAQVIDSDNGESGGIESPAQGTEGLQGGPDVVPSTDDDPPPRTARDLLGPTGETHMGEAEGRPRRKEDTNLEHTLEREVAPEDPGSSIGESGQDGVRQSVETRVRSVHSGLPTHNESSPGSSGQSASMPDVLKRLRPKTVLTFKKHDNNKEHDTEHDKEHKYYIVEERARGGCGVVYEAVDQTNERHAALKIAFDEAGTPAGNALIREANVLSNIRHEHVVKFYEEGDFTFTDTDGSKKVLPFLSMELLTGDSLENRLFKDWRAEHKRVPENDEDPVAWEQYKSYPAGAREAVLVAKAVAAALKESHVIPVVHRDLKPGNILYTGDDVLKVIDFGVSKKLSRKGSNTEKEGFSGTLQYSSPQQLAAGQSGGDPHFNWDVYSLGAILYEMLTGHVPYEVIKNPDYVPPKKDHWWKKSLPAEGAPFLVLPKLGQGAFIQIAEWDDRHQKYRIPRVRDLRPEIDPGLDEIVMRLVDQNLRPQTMGEVIQLFEDYDNGKPIPGAQYRRGVRTAKSVKYRVTSNRWKVAAGVVAAGVLYAAVSTNLEKRAYIAEMDASTQQVIAQWEKQKAGVLREGDYALLEQATIAAIDSAKLWKEKHPGSGGADRVGELDAQRKDIRAAAYEFRVAERLAQCPAEPDDLPEKLEDRVRLIDEWRVSADLALDRALQQAEQWRTELGGEAASERTQDVANRRSAMRRRYDALITETYGHVTAHASLQAEGLLERADTVGADALVAGIGHVDSALVVARAWDTRQHDRAQPMIDELLLRRAGLAGLEYERMRESFEDVAGLAGVIDYHSPPSDGIAPILSRARAAADSVAAYAARANSADAGALKLRSEQLVRDLEQMFERSTHRVRAEGLLVEYRAARDAGNMMVANQKMSAAFIWDRHEVAEEAEAQGLQGADANRRAQALVARTEELMIAQIRDRERYNRNQILAFARELGPIEEEYRRGRFLDDQEFARRCEPRVVAMRARLQDQARLGPLRFVPLEQADEIRYVAEARDQIRAAAVRVQSIYQAVGMEGSETAQRRETMESVYLNRLNGILNGARIDLGAAREEEMIRRHGEFRTRILDAIYDRTTSDAAVLGVCDQAVREFGNYVNPPRQQPKSVAQPKPR